jgi:hypothetical protein
VLAILVSTGGAEDEKDEDGDEDEEAEVHIAAQPRCGFCILISDCSPGALG